MIASCWEPKRLSLMPIVEQAINYPYSQVYNLVNTKIYMLMFIAVLMIAKGGNYLSINEIN